jgi:pimeloyl-ACP methyl ester carboxylesterase
MMFPANEDSRRILEGVGFGSARTLSFKRIPNAGHFVMLEQPAYLASVLLAFGVTAEYEFEH